MPERIDPICAGDKLSIGASLTRPDRVGPVKFAWSSPSRQASSALRFLGLENCSSAFRPAHGDRCYASLNPLPLHGINLDGSAELLIRRRSHQKTYGVSYDRRARLVDTNLAGEHDR
ncbi:MAG: hypothetical protein JWM91_5316 [Rhodospirillales bacterium]|nr:hypothetical protein [Rhodospirillales bacterium]